jgi:hypothetical protein
MRTITCDKAVPWSRSDHLMVTRFLPSNDDSEENFSGTPPSSKTEIMVNQATLGLGQLNNYACLLPLLQFFCLNHLCALKIAGVLTVPIPQLSVKSSFSALHRHSSLYLAYWGK